MTPENQRYREILKAAESLAIRTLATQPHGDEECRQHLIRGLEKLEALVESYRRKEPESGE